MNTSPEKMFLFCSKTFVEPFSYFLEISEVLLCKRVYHWYEEVIVRCRQVKGLQQGKGCPIQAISRCLSPVLICEMGHCRVTKSLCHSGRFSINARIKLIIVDDSTVWVGSSSSNSCNSSSMHFCLLHWNYHF